MSRVSSDIYRQRAGECAQQAREATLTNVRDRCLRSETAWAAMAEQAATSEADRRKSAISDFAEADDDDL